MEAGELVIGNKVIGNRWCDFKDLHFKADEYLVNEGITLPNRTRVTGRLLITVYLLPHYPDYPTTFVYVI
jgi:hypothetical protein